MVSPGVSQVVCVPNVHTSNPVRCETISNKGIQIGFRGEKNGDVMTHGVPSRVVGERVVEFQDPLAGKNCNTSRVRGGGGREVTSNVREQSMIVSLEARLGRASDFLSADMIKPIDQVIKKLVTGRRTLSSRPPFTNAERGKVKGNKVGGGRREMRERLITIHH